jgi:hypothetical protein
MLDRDALTTAVTEACALDPAYHDPIVNYLAPLPGFGLALPARDRIVQALLEHTSARELVGQLIPCGDGGAETFDFDQVAAWLVREARRRPPSEVVADFAYFLDRREVEGLKVEIIYGLQLETSIDLGARGLMLEPFGTLPACWQKAVIAQRRQFERARFHLDRWGDPIALTMRFAMSPALANPGDVAGLAMTTCRSTSAIR